MAGNANYLCDIFKGRIGLIQVLTISPIKHTKAEMLAGLYSHCLYDPDVECLRQNKHKGSFLDCTQVPIIAPIKQKKAEMLEQQPLRTNYSNEFLGGLMNNPELIRNIAVVGHLHHGKTLVSIAPHP